MNKNEYVTPKVIEHGDVKEITLQNDYTPTTLDANYPAGTPADELGWNAS